MTGAPRSAHPPEPRKAPRLPMTSPFGQGRAMSPVSRTSSSEIHAGSAVSGSVSTGGNGTGIRPLRMITGDRTRTRFPRLGDRRGSPLHEETATSLPMWRPFGRKGHIGGGPSEPGGPFPEPRGGRVPETVGESCHRRTGHRAGWPIAVAARSEPMREVCVPEIARARCRAWRGSAVGSRGGLEPPVRVGTAQEDSGPPSVCRSPEGPCRPHPAFRTGWSVRRPAACGHHDALLAGSVLGGPCR